MDLGAFPAVNPVSSKEQTKLPWLIFWPGTIITVISDPCEHGLSSKPEKSDPAITRTLLI